MLNQQTIEKLYAMRMRGMADAFTQQQEDPGSAQLGFEERFAMLVDRQWTWRQNRALQRRLRDGRQIGDPTVADSILDRLVHAAHKLIDSSEKSVGEFRFG